MRILILSNIHDHVYAHITTSINISQNFKYIKFIKYGDISISKSCITQNQSRKIIFNEAHITQALIHYVSSRNIIIKLSKSNKNGNQISHLIK